MPPEEGYYRWRPSLGILRPDDVKAKPTDRAIDLDDCAVVHFFICTGWWEHLSQILSLYFHTSDIMDAERIEYNWVTRLVNPDMHTSIMSLSG